MRDISRNISAVLALAPAVQSAAAQGPAIDIKGYGSAAILVNTGAIVSAGDFGVKLQESDTDQAGDFGDVAAGSFDSNAPATLLASSAYRLGYRGTKRFIRVALTKAGGTSIAAGAVAVLAHPASAPVA